MALLESAAQWIGFNEGELEIHRQRFRPKEPTDNEFWVIFIIGNSIDNEFLVIFVTGNSIDNKFWVIFGIGSSIKSPKKWFFERKN